MPVLHGTLGVIFCTKREALEMGDHMVWFGNVVSVQEVSPAAASIAICACGNSVVVLSPQFKGAPGNPLLYYARTYRHVGEEAFMAKFESAELAFDKCVNVEQVLSKDG
jgi:flavin reductase (DIM6/NTAB) family NADH-FMN oxidoreductase RutF